MVFVISMLKVGGDNLSSVSDAVKPFLQELANKIKMSSRMRFITQTNLNCSENYCRILQSFIERYTMMRQNLTGILNIWFHCRPLIEDVNQSMMSMILTMLQNVTTVLTMLQNVTTVNNQLTESEICEWINGDEEHLRCIMMRATRKRM
ncbi:hypothetical protein QE152_g13414 [Popillia japonica]|uniref:Uncharacterized protein n=1 Tax=Popillia japonica TaxID=7064 RepID=A0AAW1LDP7_POPJA